MEVSSISIVGGQGHRVKKKKHGYNVEKYLTIIDSSQRHIKQHLHRLDSYEGKILGSDDSEMDSDT